MTGTQDSVAGPVNMDALAAPQALEWVSENYEAFGVDWAASGTDLICHFWPAEHRPEFCGPRTEQDVPKFALLLDEKFGYWFGHRPMEAAFYSVLEQQAMASVQEVTDGVRFIRPCHTHLKHHQLPPPQETVYVKLPDARADLSWMASLKRLIHDLRESTKGWA